MGGCGKATIGMADKKSLELKCVRIFRLFDASLGIQCLDICQSLVVSKRHHLVVSHNSENNNLPLLVLGSINLFLSNWRAEGWGLNSFQAKKIYRSLYFKSSNNMIYSPETP